jgi:hypothetical protein
VRFFSPRPYQCVRHDVFRPDAGLLYYGAAMMRAAIKATPHIARFYRKFQYTTHLLTIHEQSRLTRQLNKIIVVQGTAQQ